MESSECCENLESFGRKIIKSAESALAYMRPSTSPELVPSIKELTAPLRAEAEAEADPVLKHEKIKQLHREKKRIKQARSLDHFLKSALHDPRESKITKLQPIECSGGLSFDPNEWKEAFTSYYRELFADVSNETPVQDARLAALKAEARHESHIPVPQFLIHEVLSSAIRTRSKAPGFDKITWGILAHLPPSALGVLRRLVECRLNACDGHDKIVDGWCDVLVQLIPKLKSSPSVKNWRPIALCSILQKLYTAVLTRLSKYYCSPVSPEQAGFTENRQVMEITECTRLLLQKAYTWSRTFLS
jgi:hypothetical protein